MKGLPRIAYYFVLIPYLILTVIVALIWSPRESAYLLAAFLGVQLAFRLSPWDEYVPRLRTKWIDAVLLLGMICALLYLAPWGNAQ